MAKHLPLTEQEEIELNPSNPIERNQEEANPPELSNREKRQQRRTQKATNVVNQELASQGIDVDQLTSQPFSSTRIDELSETLSKLGTKDMANQIKTRAKVYGKPILEALPQIDKQSLIESAKKQKRAGWMDAFYALGEGMQGRTADPNRMLSTHYKRQRDEKYQQFKDISQRNKAAQIAWEAKTAQDYINWVDEKIKDQTLSATERERYNALKNDFTLKQKKLQYDYDVLAAKKSGEYYKPTYKAQVLSQIDDNSWQLPKTAKKNTDLFMKLAGNRRDVVHEFAKVLGFADKDGNVKLSAADFERISADIIETMYDIDPQTNIATLKPGMENYLTNLSNSIQAIKDAESDYEALKAKVSKLVSEQSKQKDRAKIKEQYAPQLKAAEDKIKLANEQKQSLFKGKKTEGSNPQQPTQNTGKPTTKFGQILQDLK